MTASWYFIFYYDFLFKLLQSFSIKFPLTIAQDFLRLHLCLSGVALIAKNHPSAFLYQAFFAICKSSGFMFIKYFEHIIDHGLSKPLSIPNSPTKTCVLASFAFAMQASNIIDLGGNGFILIFATLIAITVKTFSAFTNDPYDPYTGLETMSSKLIFGGLPQSEEKASKKVHCMRSNYYFLNF